ncbi:YihY/virulence factor BrkB family protein [Clostridium perfringens]|uniref:YihY/virulence factor BrkB family protein n=1 Tax=Clostridium perfringens TaxID=1502 RepID=UPI0007062DE3|nr:YihY/virulence factor BrkB family protein [Clostridium perfringens]ALG47670.1 Inner membrane protein YihY, formerly thought to be RNase BN [Clostridium perfringens]EGT0683247.1 YihY/virulence factor BrkB family protein [Clostridium perfringens]EGT0685577.1 YihY/virulence factor BrkB family protein [Clostridium perfringens]EHK2347683.1 YihY/virulence factor BrkB family protein [Clostridium perfringens]EJT5920496.1 YihY/virulence factor BrkB family protein [Clostridium perfringens]
MKKKSKGFLRKTVIFLVMFIKKIGDDDIFALGAQLAYYMVLSFIPFLMFLMTLVGFSHLNSDAVLNLLSNVMPTEAFNLIQSTVIEIVDREQTGLLWISIALAIWVSSSGFKAVIKGLNKAYGVKETRSYIKLKLISMIYTILLALIVIATLFLFVFGDVIGDFFMKVLEHPEVIYYIWNMLRYVVVILIMILFFMFLYNATPCVRLGWLEVIPGAVITTLGWISISYIFAYYVNNFSNYSRLYGSLGAVFMFMTWMFITSMILILGGEINAVLAEKNRLKDL